MESRDTHVAKINFLTSLSALSFFKYQGAIAAICLLLSVLFTNFSEFCKMELERGLKLHAQLSTLMVMK